MKHYTVDELDFKNGSEEEQIRTRKIFEDLKLRASTDKNFLERESDFLYMGLKLSELNDGKPEDFKACDNPIFKELYLTYFHNNLSGPFYKHKKGKGIVEVGQREKEKDFAVLMNISNKWFEVIKNDRHSDQILQELSIETRRDLKALDKQYPPLLKRFRRGQDDYRLKKDKIILHSKFIYLLVKSVIENNDSSDFEIPFANETVEFTIFSLIHIISRHYAQAIKDNPDKSYHYENFYPTELHIDLRNILIEIDKLQLINLNETDITFKYNKVIYKLWIKKRYKSIKGQGNIEVYRIQTLYPIHLESEIKSITENYNENQISEVLSLFTKK